MIMLIASSTERMMIDIIIVVVEDGRSHRKVLELITTNTASITLVRTKTVTTRRMERRKFITLFLLFSC